MVLRMPLSMEILFVLVGGEQRVEDAQDGLSGAGRKTLNFLQSAPDADVDFDGEAWELGRTEQLVGTDPESLGKGGKDVGWRMRSLAFVVGNHAIGDADFVAELGLGEASGLPQAGEPEAEGFFAGMAFELRHGIEGGDG